VRHRKFSEDDGEVHTKCLIINGEEYWAAWFADDPDERHLVSGAGSEREAKRLLFERFNNLTNNIKPTT